MENLHDAIELNVNRVFICLTRIPSLVLLVDHSELLQVLVQIKILYMLHHVICVGRFMLVKLHRCYVVGFPNTKVITTNII